MKAGIVKLSMIQASGNSLLASDYIGDPGHDEAVAKAERGLKQAHSRLRAAKRRRDEHAAWVRSLEASGAVKRLK